MFVRQGRKQEREEKMFCCSYFSWDTFRGKLPLPSTVYLFSKILLKVSKTRKQFLVFSKVAFEIYRPL